MAKFLRDEFLKNLTIDENALLTINEFLSSRAHEENLKLGYGNEDVTPQELEKLLILNYVIRFDNKGYHLSNLNDLIRYYRQANNVERVIFILDSNESAATNGAHGYRLEARLDQKDIYNSFLSVTADDSNWVEATFSSTIDILKKSKNKNNFVRNTWTQFLVQIFGVGAGFVFSLVAASKFSSMLINIENPFIISFLFAFLIFSNAWGFINQQLLRFLNYSFPNIQFNRIDSPKMHWLVQTVIGGVVAAFTLYLLSLSLDYLADTLAS